MVSFSKKYIDIESLLAGQKEAVAKALNLVENQSPEYAKEVSSFVEVISQKARHERHLIGISGPPGVGKSSMISRLIEHYRSQKKTVGVLSVDPSSKRSGGALLGDRIRIKHDPSDPRVFIRSMAAGQHLGGLAKTTRLDLMVYEAVYDKIILETVGVGQSETEIENVVDTVMVVVQPGSGDLLQFLKAGIMEIPHLLVINKADQRALADKTFQDLSSAILFESGGQKGWKMEVIMASALDNTGFDRIIQVLENHRDFLEKAGIEHKRKTDLFWWIIGFFKERYGSYGVDLLGGEERIMRYLSQNDTKNFFMGLKILENKMKERIVLR